MASWRSVSTQSLLTPSLPWALYLSPFLGLSCSTTPTSYPTFIRISDPCSRKHIAGAADPAAHKIYIWDLSNDGQFTSTLDGGREPLIHLHVCPSPTSPYPRTFLYSFLAYPACLPIHPVAPNKIHPLLHNQPRQRPHLARTQPRTLGRIRRRFRRSRRERRV